MCDDPTPQQISSVKRSRKGDWLPRCTSNTDIKPPRPLTDLLNYIDSNKNFREIILLNGKFGTVDRLGSKRREYNISPLCCIIGNLPTKFRSELNNKSILFRSLFSQKYCNHAWMTKPN